MKSMRKAGAKATVVVAALALTLSACASGSDKGAAGDNGEHSTTAKQPAAGFDAKTMGSDYPMPEEGVAYDNAQDRDKLQEGGTLTLATTEIGPNWNSLSTDGNTGYMGQFWTYYQPQLWDYDVSGNPTPNPDYLTKVEVTSEDPLVVTYDINEKATWNDGTPIDWTAFEATWKTQSGKNEGYNPPSTAGYDQIASVAQGENPKQAVVTFDTPFYPYQYLFINIEHPAAAADPATFTEGWVNNPHTEWAAGPFTVDSFDDTQATFVPNDKWWGAKPLLEKVQFKVMDDSASINAFQNGEIDATGVATADRLKVAQAMDKVQIRVNTATSTGVVTFNTKADSLKDLAVRKAITQATDVAKLGQIKYQGLNWTEDTLGSEIMFPFQDGYENNMPEDSSYSVENAGKTLEEAGYAKGSDGYYAKDGAKVSVKYTFFGDSPVQTAIANAIQAMGKAAGIEIVLDNQDPSKFSDVVVGGQYEMLIMAWSASDPYGYSTSGCQLYCSDSDSNFAYIGDAKADEGFKKAGQIEDTAEAIKQLNEAEKQALALYGTFPLFNGPVMLAVKEGLANYGGSSMASASGFKALNPHPENVGWEK